MVKLTIDDKKVVVEKGSSIIQACDQAGIEVPRFCYHDRLKVAGNCRMCLVEVKGKLVASCAAEVQEDIRVITDSPMVKKAREGVMEFLLINHPLDCPICDQGGECDLQDQAFKYGSRVSRFDEEKRAVPDKNMGPLIKTNMNRCIHCTRCVRFATDIAGMEEIGSFGRGEATEIVTYLGRPITSELSGNLIDVCPVGALTSKPNAFRFRSWELVKTETIDVSDAVGSNIRVDVKGLRVERILPRLNESINEEWISDKTRFSCDGLSNQRLDRPYIRVGNELREATWDEAMTVIAERLKNLKGSEIGAIAGDLADAESMLVLRDILDNLGSPNRDSRSHNIFVDPSNRSSYLFNTTINGIEDSDLCLLIGCNPRLEATMVNARIRKRYTQRNYKIFSIGTEAELTYPVEILGNDPKILEEIASGKHKICSALESAKKPMLILGYGVLIRDDAEHLLYLFNKICTKYGFVSENWNGFNVLHRDASAVAGLDLGFVPKKGGLNSQQMVDAAANKELKFLYLLGSDRGSIENIRGKSFVVYQGHHGDRSASVADVILPSAAFTEKDATYINLEGRIQNTRKCLNAPGMAKDDSEILLNLASVIGISLPYENKQQLRIKMHSFFNNIINKKLTYPKRGLTLKDNVVSLDMNYYMSNVICRASKTMVRCVNFGVCYDT